MTPERGTPAIRVRLEPALQDKAQKAFPPVKGRSGGLSLALRRLLYLALDEPMPAQYGEIGRSHEVDEVEALVRALESRESVGGAALAQAQNEALELLAADEGDAVDRVRLHAALGRLWLIEPEAPSKKS